MILFDLVCDFVCGLFAKIGHETFYLSEAIFSLRHTNKI